MHLSLFVYVCLNPSLCLRFCLTVGRGQRHFIALEVKHTLVSHLISPAWQSQGQLVFLLKCHQWCFSSSSCLALAESHFLTYSALSCFWTSSQFHTSFILKSIWGSVTLLHSLHLVLLLPSSIWFLTHTHSNKNPSVCARVCACMCACGYMPNLLLCQHRHNMRTDWISNEHEIEWHLLS